MGRLLSATRSTKVLTACVAYTQSFVHAKVTGQKCVYTELTNSTSIGMCEFQGIPEETLTLNWLRTNGTP